MAARRSRPSWWPIISASGADRVLTVDLHLPDPGFFDIPTDNLFGGPVMIDDIKERYGRDKIVMVSLDVGGAVRARAPTAERRPRHRRQALTGSGQSEVMNIIGEAV